MSEVRRRLAVAPRRVRLALAAACVLAVVAVALLAVGARSGDDGGAGGADESAEARGPSTTSDTGGADEPVEGHGPSTTLDTGGLDIPTPDGWQAIPVPDVGFGIAVPEGWEAVLLSEDGLATLAGAAPLVPDFSESAHAAAAQGGVLYAAGEDEDGQVSDVVVRAAPATGVEDAAGLVDYVEALATGSGRTDVAVDEVDDAARPTVRLDFSLAGEAAADPEEAGGGDAGAVGTETFVLGDDGIVWSVVVTSDDAGTHGDLVAGIVDTLTLAPG